MGACGEAYGKAAAYEVAVAEVVGRRGRGDISGGIDACLDSQIAAREPAGTYSDLVRAFQFYLSGSFVFVSAVAKGTAMHRVVIGLGNGAARDKEKQEE